jgi:transitional endoplasmic reticulum ATPase
MAGAADTLSLTVAEALPKDVGRGIARMDPEDMARLGVGAGDIVELGPRQQTGLRAMPTYPDQRGNQIIQIDGIARANAQAALGETVEIKPCAFAVAVAVVLTATTAPAFGSAKGSEYLGRVLEGLPVTTGDRVRATLIGGQYREFTVTESAPGGVVLIGPKTMISVQGEGLASRPEKSGITYEDVGGLHQELARIREMVELPLKHPELFERLGIEPPRGVLLYGPPGSGKTLIAKAVANETDASFFHVSGPEIIHKFYGESEAHLRAIFEKARAQAPSIIFIDEIDAIATKREEVRGDQAVERRVVAQLLALMDGLESRGQVGVIGATNLPDVLDPALRRPGRFDREIEIDAPDRAGRLGILEIHTRGMPLTADVSLDRLAETTHGFVGADLAALGREAAMAALRRAMPRLHLEDGQIPYQFLLELEVGMDDFLEALTEIEPSALREVFTEIPDVRWSDIGGLRDAKRVLTETIVWPVQRPDIFRLAATRPPKGVLLTGPPGSGKTMLAKAVANETGVNFISVKGPELLSKWVGESEKALRQVFRKARQASPCVIFFDEIDALVPIRGAGAEVAERVLSQFLTELDGVEELRGVTVVAATNRPDMLDPALVRAGRLEVRLELTMPDEAARREIFAIHTRGKPLADDIDLQRFAAATEGASGADIEAICRRATMMAIREVLDPGRDFPEAGTLLVTASHFQSAVDDVVRPGS